MIKRGYAYYSARQTEKAAEAFKEAVKFYPQDWGAWTNLVLIFSIYYCYIDYYSFSHFYY